MKRPWRILRSTAIVVLGFSLALLLAGCDGPHYTYDSIWSDVYGNIPSYQDELEELEVE